MIAAARVSRVVAVALLTVFSAFAGARPAAAQSPGVTVDRAEISAGLLIISGLAPRPNYTIKIKNSDFAAKADAANRYTFSVDYRTANCRITLLTPDPFEFQIGGCGPGTIFRGPWLSTENYVFGDLVTSDGGTWFATATNKNKRPPNQTNYWMAFAEKGARGQAGLAGPAGPQGEAGLQGAQGPTGPQGPTGAQGPSGAAGAAGAAGAQGEQGPQGPQGIQGPAGPPGAGLKMIASMVHWPDCVGDDTAGITWSKRYPEDPESHCKGIIAPGLGTVPMFFSTCASMLGFGGDSDGSGEVFLVPGPCGPGGGNSSYMYLLVMESGPRATGAPAAATAGRGGTN